MGIQKVAFNFMVECGGKLSKSLLCSKPIPKPIDFKGLKYVTNLKTDTFQLTKNCKKDYDLLYTHIKKHFGWSEFDAPDYYKGKNVLHIDKLYASGNGAGARTIQKLVRKSLENPITQGRVTLEACMLDPRKGHPLGFYYKLGFRSPNPKLNKACEEWLANGGEKSLAPGTAPRGYYKGLGIIDGNMYLPRENIVHCLNYASKQSSKANAEYDKLLNDIFDIRGKSWNEIIMPQDSSIIMENIKIYPNIPHKLKGMLPYCGKCDISNEINRYLSGREFRNVSKESIEKFSKLLDSSLEECDKDFGVFKGIVYRGGYFSPESKQFYSSSFELNPELLMFHAGDGSSKQFHIIKTKSGHNINAFQEKYCAGELKEQFLEEKEILLSKKSKFKEAISNSELEFERQKMAEKIFAYCKKFNVRGMSTIDEIISKIKIWEEV